MSAIAGVFGGNGAAADARLRRMLAAMRKRGDDQLEVWHGESAALAVERGEWEMGRGFSDGALLARGGGLVVAADASLFYRDDLRRALVTDNVEPLADSPAHLILAAFQAWGSGCAERLEGDWAFIVWDAEARRVFCSRDFAGRRPLHYAVVGDALIVATSIAGVLGHPDCPEDLNLVAVADTVAGFAAASHETVYSAIRRLPSGCNLNWATDGLRTERHWNPQPVAASHGLQFEEAAEHLGELLGAAVSERLAPDGPTSIQLSGGWDSTAIFGVAKEKLRERGVTDGLLPVSISYPAGDPGREDETIQTIADFWKTPVHWLSIDDIPLFDRVREGAAERDDPLTHVYENWNRTLVGASRSLGAAVMFDGFGGDSLFQSSPVFFADLLRSGRWISLMREWEAKGMKGWRNFFRWAIHPLLPGPVLEMAARLRSGRRLRSYLERPLPRWIKPEFAERHALEERERSHLPVYGCDTRASDELFWYLTYPFINRMLSANHGFGLEQAVELRSPLYDRRIVEFAIARPVGERSSRDETKRLLRRMGRGRLPDSVLAPRTTRTGVTSGYLDRSLRADFSPLAEAAFADSRLADLGILDVDALRRGAGDFYRGNGQLAVPLLFTLQTELWLQAHTGANRAEDGKVRQAVATATGTKTDRRISAATAGV